MSSNVQNPVGGQAIGVRVQPSVVAWLDELKVRLFSGHGGVPLSRSAAIRECLEMGHVALDGERMDTLRALQKKHGGTIGDVLNKVIDVGLKAMEKSK